MAKAYIALGSNLAFAGQQPAATIQAATRALTSLGTLLAKSSLYETEPVGFKEQPSFVNAVVSLETSLPAEDLLVRLLELERSFGRERAAGLVNGPRTLDLDLLLLDEQVSQTDRLTLPHPRMAERRFVLQPLAEIAPGLRHPLLGAAMQELLERLPANRGGGRDAVTLLH